MNPWFQCATSCATHIPAAALAGYIALHGAPACNEACPAVVVPPSRRGKTAPRQLDPWREAAAHARAEATVKAAGVRPPQGKKLTDHSDFKLALDDARQVVGAWPKETLLKAKKHIGIMEWHAKLTGADQSLDALFADGVAAPAVLTTFAEAAD